MRERRPVAVVVHVAVATVAVVAAAFITIAVVLAMTDLNFRKLKSMYTSRPPRSQHCPAAELEVDSFLSDQSYSDDGAFVAAASHGTAEVAMSGSSAGGAQ